MISKNAISPQIPTIASGEPTQKAVDLMEEWHLSHLPVVNQGLYVGLISANELTLSAPTDVVGHALLYAPFVREESHILEALHLLSQHPFDLLPVLSNENNYLGAIDRKGLLDQLAKLCNTPQEGALVVVEMAEEEYVASKLVRLAEDNNMTLLALFTSLNEQHGKLLVTLKVNRTDATPFIHSLERFGYSVIELFQPQSPVDNSLRQRFDELIYYLEM